MKKIIFIATLFLFTNFAFAGDFINQFIQKCVEEGMPVNNVNIGKSMLDKMASSTDDEELKNIFHDLSSIRIITTENKKDSRIYFKKATELAAQEFSDYQEVVSVNERKTKITILQKQLNEKTQELIFIGLDEDSKLTIITVSGKIDFKSISKLSESFGKEIKTNEETPPETVGTEK